MAAVSSGAASQRQVAAAFGVNEATMWRWRSDYKASGLLVLLPQRKGPKRPSKLTHRRKACRVRSTAIERAHQDRGGCPHARVHQDR